MNRLIVMLSLCLSVLLHGCGTESLRSFAYLSNTVVLDWTGGDSPLWDGSLPPIDLAEFKLDWPDERTLADVEGFKEMVRAEVENVLNGSGLHMTIEGGEQRLGITVVHFSQVTDPKNPASLGRGHFDICNVSDQDYSIIYAAKFLEGRRLDEAEWVRFFANVAAHEIAHNIGFDHVEPGDVPESEFTELMLVGQTTSQRVSAQRIIVEQDTCALFAAKAQSDRRGRSTLP